jgi:hypothetical protein
MHVPELGTLIWQDGVDPRDPRAECGEVIVGAKWKVCNVVQREFRHLRRELIALRSIQFSRHPRVKLIAAGLL